MIDWVLCRTALHKVETWFLLLSAGTFFYFGFSFLLWPDVLCGVIDIQLTSATATTDIRATYGGFEIGLGCFLLGCAMQPRLHGVGLALSALTIGGFGAGRGFGFLVDGDPSQLMLLLFAIETSATAIAAFLLLRWRNSRGDATHV